MIQSDRVPADLDSHTFHHTAQPLPNLDNFQTRSKSGLSSQEEASCEPALLDGRLLATDVSLLQELAHRHGSSAPPAKRRRPLPPQLTLAIPHPSDSRNEWTLPVRSAGFVEGGPATQIHAEHSGVGAGYFSVSFPSQALFLFLFSYFCIIYFLRVCTRLTMRKRERRATCLSAHANFTFWR